VEVTLPEDRPLEGQMIDATYWKVNHLESDQSLDELLLDYE
jgi:hypothetical protein